MKPSSTDAKTVTMVCACDAKGGDPHNMKHIKYEGDGNKTQRTFKDGMECPTQ